MPVAAPPSIEAVRAWFPALSAGFAYMDNAGGSQVPGCVADAVRDYMLNTYVQIGGTYPASRKATETVAEAHEMVNTLFGGEAAGKVIFGSSSSTLCRMLSDCYAEILKPEDEVVVAENGHEANVYPWLSLAARGLNIRLWEPDKETGRLSAATLKSLMNDHTKLVAFPHVSNILGAIEDYRAFIDLAHQAGARVVLDSVAYAPHAALDVQAWGVDWCLFSCYKVFGPHMGALWGSDEALAELTGRNHPFIRREDVPLKFELGGVLHEGCAGLLALRSYFGFLAGQQDRFDRAIVKEAFANAEQLERPLTKRLIEFLNTKPHTRIIGPATAGPERVGTVSFVHDLLSSEQIVEEVQKHGIGLKFGNFYSVRLLERLGLNPKDGVARVSFAHYNSPEELKRLIRALDPIL